jgi:phosphate transport system protein
MRNRFDQQLEKLNNMLVEMGTLIETAINTATEALMRQDMALVEKVFAYEPEVDDMERDIASLGYRLLLQQQPVAKDLRLITAALKMITDMERIGDQAADIADLTRLMAGRPYVKRLEHIPQMARATIKMVTGSIDAFVKKDLELAETVMTQDDVVDDLFRKVKLELIELIKENRADGEQAIDLLMVAKYFERIGDHAVNIAEWVVYSIMGESKHGEDIRSGR